MRNYDLHFNTLKTCSEERLWEITAINRITQPLRGLSLKLLQETGLLDHKLGDVLGLACDCVSSVQQQPRENINFVRKIIPSRIN